MGLCFKPIPENKIYKGTLFSSLTAFLLIDNLPGSLPEKLPDKLSGRNILATANLRARQE